MNIGALCHRVSIQQRGATVDGYGQQVTTWTTVASAWAKIEPLTGREQLAAAELRASVSHKITMRYRSIFANPQTAAQYRLVYGSRYFDITASLNPEERGVWIVLDCTEGLSNG